MQRRRTIRIYILCLDYAAAALTKLDSCLALCYSVNYSSISFLALLLAVACLSRLW